MKPRLPSHLSRSTLRPFTTTSSHLNSPPTPPSQPPSPQSQPSLPPSSKWLSTVKSRIGKCIIYGIQPTSFHHATTALRVLGQRWREILAGREGFFVDRKRVGISRREVVWREIDIMGHVNNVAYVKWAESGRINWARNYARYIDPEHKEEWSDLWTPKGDGLILKSMKTEYKFPMTFPDTITLSHKLSYLPSPQDTHFTLSVLIVSEKHQRVAARCEEELVVYDYRKGEKVPIRPWMMKAFRRTWEEQEREKERVKELIWDVEKDVTGLEEGSWRGGVKEDLGSAA